MSGSFSRRLILGWLPERQGNQNATLAPAGAFKTSDGRFISIAVLRNEHWTKFCAAMGLEQLERDPRFETNAARVANRGALDDVIAPMLSSQSVADWLAPLRAADILCGPINTFADFTADLSLMARLPLVDAMAPGADRPDMPPLVSTGRRPHGVVLFSLPARSYSRPNVAVPSLDRWVPWQAVAERIVARSH